ncbi:MAG TPA: GNAT family N-acetyltransferase [Herpetosiphonaceae bacterium]|nr:GNAT family N-acetyltransferase [Herpetosiphonaceae bacterium]
MQEGRTPLVNFTTERLAYGPVTEAHLPLSAKWANDWAVSRPRGMVLRPYGQDTVVRWNEQARTNPNHIVFVMYERASNRPIGEASLTGIDWVHRTAEFGVLIGETDCWGGAMAPRRPAPCSATDS